MLSTAGEEYERRRGPGVARGVSKAAGDAWNGVGLSVRKRGKGARTRAGVGGGERGDSMLVVSAGGRDDEEDEEERGAPIADISVSTGEDAATNRDMILSSCAFISARTCCRKLGTAAGGTTLVRPSRRIV
jgi:hypothetical protein